jgi:hypothetical protein
LSAHYLSLNALADSSLSIEKVDLFLKYARLISTLGYGVVSALPQVDQSPDQTFILSLLKWFLNNFMFFTRHTFHTKWHFISIRLLDGVIKTLDVVWKNEILFPIPIVCKDLPPYIPEELHDDVFFKKNICPITQLPIRYPCTYRDQNHKFHYERSAFIKWINFHQTDFSFKEPLTNKWMPKKNLYFNQNLLKVIENRLRQLKKEKREEKNA